MRLQLGAVTFDSDRRQLLRGPAEVRVSPKAFRLLETLVEARPRALSKADLHEKLWPGVFVSESNLAALVSEVRGALEDDARHPVYVRTVHGFGYAFAGEAEAEALAATAPSRGVAVHRLIWGQTEIDLYEGENVIGREREASVWIADPSVSRRHACVRVSGNDVTLEDLESKNGTYLDDKRLTGSAAISDGASIRVGSIPLSLRTVSTTASTLTQTSE